MAINPKIQRTQNETSHTACYTYNLPKKYRFFLIKDLSTYEVVWIKKLVQYPIIWKMGSDLSKLPAYGFIFRTPFISKNQRFLAACKCSRFFVKFHVGTFRSRIPFWPNLNSPLEHVIKVVFIIALLPII